jgi:hypothetical protein
MLGAGNEYPEWGSLWLNAIAKTVVGTRVTGEEVVIPPVFLVGN